MPWCDSHAVVAVSESHHVITGTVGDARREGALEIDGIVTILTADFIDVDQLDAAEVQQSADACGNSFGLDVDVGISIAIDILGLDDINDTSPALP